MDAFDQLCATRGNLLTTAACKDVLSLVRARVAEPEIHCLGDDVSGLCKYSMSRRSWSPVQQLDPPEGIYGRNVQWPGYGFLVAPTSNGHNVIAYHLVSSYGNVTRTNHQAFGVVAVGANMSDGSRVCIYPKFSHTWFVTLVKTPDGPATQWQPLDPACTANLYPRFVSACAGGALWLGGTASDKNAVFYDVASGSTVNTAFCRWALFNHTDCLLQVAQDSPVVECWGQEKCVLATYDKREDCWTTAVDLDEHKRVIVVNGHTRSVINVDDNLAVRLVRPRNYDHYLAAKSGMRPILEFYDRRAMRAVPADANDIAPLRDAQSLLC